MQAATAAVDFTPKPGLVLQGHAGSPPSSKVIYPLQVRAIVFEDGGVKAAIASIDVIGTELKLTRRVRERIEKQCGIAADHIMICSSHTHCAPAAIPVLNMTPDPAFMQSFEDALVKAVVEAAGKLEPVTLGLGCGQAMFNINRRPITATPGIGATMRLNYGGVVDRRARLLRVDKQDGSPLAVLFHYSCHPTTRGGGNGEISSDYPGIARQRIEEKLGCHALYIPGCFANIRPAIIDPKTGGFGNASVDELNACGHELGDGVVVAAKYVSTQPAAGIAAATRDYDMPFQPALPMAELEEMAAQDTSRPPGSLSAPWAKRIIERVKANDMPTSERSEMQMMRVGPLLLLTVGGECVQEIGHAIEKRVFPKANAENVWAVGYTNDMIGYITTQQQKEEGGYEPNAYPYFDRPARFNNEETTLVELAAKMVGA